MRNSGMGVCMRESEKTLQGDWSVYLWPCGRYRQADCAPAFAPLPRGSRFRVIDFHALYTRTYNNFQTKNTKQLVSLSFSFSAVWKKSPSPARRCNFVSKAVRRVT